jgi:hypothetical protein
MNWLMGCTEQAYEGASVAHCNEFDNPLPLVLHGTHRLGAIPFFRISWNYHVTFVL